MDSVEFLDAVRARHKIPSDRKLADFLGIERPRVSMYRTRKRRLDPNACIAVAKALQLPPEHVFAAIEAERAKRTEHRRIWERLAKLAKSAHVVVALGFAAATSSPAPSSPHGAAAQDLYIMFNRRRRSVPVSIERRIRRRRRASHPALAAAS